MLGCPSEERHLSFLSLYFSFPRDFFGGGGGRSPLIQRHFSRPQVLHVTPTQDAPCLPGTGSDDDGHPDGAPSSLPRHPTGECPPAPMGSSRPLATPNSCINYPARLSNDRYKVFHPQIRDCQNFTPFLIQSPGLKGLGTNDGVFFPLSSFFWGRGVFSESRRSGVFAASTLTSWKDEMSGSTRGGFSRRNGLWIYFHSVFWQPVAGGK